ncbi:MAG: penicillin-binding protein activator, partial [bacterium]
MPDEATAFGLESGAQIVVEDDAWTVAARAEALAPAQAVALLLPAIAASLKSAEFDAAQLLIARAKPKPMTAEQRNALHLHRARLAQSRGYHRRAIALLRELEAMLDASAGNDARDSDSATFDSNTLDSTSSAASDSNAPTPPPFDPAVARGEILLLLADSQQALGRYSEAAETLSRGAESRSPEQRIANQRRLLDFFDSRGPLGRLLLRESATDDRLVGWIALSEILQVESPQARDAGIQQWRARYRRHPAATRLLNQNLLDGRAQPQRIALLLPLTSPFGQAAQAFYEGFMESRRQQDAARRPVVSLHDIGADPSLVALYYRAAVGEGAGFVVGPLGRRAVGALLAGNRLALPTLLLGDVPADHAAPGVYGLSLSPEDEARQAAARAFADGHTRAGVL